MLILLAALAEEELQEQKIRLQKINEEGRKAFLDGKSKTEVPYRDPQEHNNWIAGFNEAKSDIERNKKTFADWLKNPTDRIKK